MTQNLWGRRGDWDARHSALRAGLEELRPDLVALPESVVTDDYDQVHDVLGPEFHVAHQKAREPGDGTDDLHLTPRTEGFACATLAVEIPAPEHLGQLLFAFHNPSWKLDQAHERELQAAACERIFDQPVEGVWASDHFGLCVELAVPEQR